MKYTIEVRVRNIEDAEATFLGHFAPDQILELPNLFRTFTTYDANCDALGFAAAQFVFAEDGSIYFEIVVAADA